MTQKNQKTSDILYEIIAHCDRDDTITIREFLDKMGHRGLALVILVFAILAMIAGAIPGFSTITGIPILFISAQIMLGRRTIWLPKAFYAKTLSPRIVHSCLSRSLKPLRRMEALLKPRLPWLTGTIMEPLLGFIMVVLAIILSLPIPGGNFLPSTAIGIMALAILERDGILVIGALAMIALTAGIMLELIRYAVILLQAVF